MRLSLRYLISKIYLEKLHKFSTFDLTINIKTTKMVEEEEILLVPDTAALMINRSIIQLPNIFRNELENEFELSI